MRYGSVCSGIEAASIAWEPLGFKPAWFSEIEAFPSAVLDHHWPQVPNLGDMTTIAEKILKGKIEAPDILVGGTPCQAFSVAGNRESLSDDRGNLTLKFVELTDAIDTIRIKNGQPPVIVVWENVPGVLSTKDNAFGCFLGKLSHSGCELQPPRGKWGNAGAVYGKRSIAWRILDAKYFGVPQRRRRVFLVASAREGFNPAEILFESKSVSGDFEKSRDARKDITGFIKTSFGKWKQALIAGTLRAQGGDLGGGSENIIVTSKKVSGPILASCGDKQFLGNQEAFSGDYFIIHGTQDPIISNTTTHCLGRNNGQENVLITNGVRRLTPIECERLQGFPDNHTLVPYRNSTATDTPRYKVIGNSMAVPVMRWIGQRIKEGV